ncbi:MAG: hypothetical protein JXQ72_02065, partial [Anaerolineae bacterium]|nr:hypothetical protein [Anaerolineae bacterium]
MSDDLSNLFDDDSLLPDWLQDNSASDADDAGDSGDSTDAPPWEQMFGEAPAAPDVPDSGGARDDVAPPWEQAPGPPGAPAAPAEPDAFGAAPPWAQSPADAGTPAAAAAGKDIFSGEMTWGTGSPGTPSAPAGEIPRGLTGELPWMGDMPPRDRGAVGMPSELADLGDFDFGDSSAGADPGASGVSDDAWLAADLPDFGAADTGAADDFDAFDAAADDDDDAWLRADLSQPEPAAPEIPAAPPDQPSMAELAGLRDEQFTFDSLLDEFDIDEVPEPPAPAKLPSLRDRLLADMPEPDDFDDFAEQDDFAGEAGADDLDWLAADDAFDGAFGGALDEPEAPAEPEFPRASSPIRRLEPLAPPSEPDSGLDDFDFDDLPSLDDLVPDETLDEYGFDTSSVPQIDDQTLDAMLATLPDTKPGDAPGGMTDWLDGTLDESGAAEPEPPPEPTRSGGVIRRLGGAPPPAPEPEPEPSGDDLLPGWLSQADEFGDTGADDLTYEEWERRQIEQEIEASKTAEDRLLENVPEWFADGADAAKAPLPAEFAGPEPP